MKCSFKLRTHNLASRDFLFPIALLFYFIASQTAFGEDEVQKNFINQHDAELMKSRDVPFQAIPEIEPESGRTALELVVEFAVNSVGPYRLLHRSYNGKLVGPTIRVKPGETLELRLTNALPRETQSAPNVATEPHGFNVTNIHTHGLHVSPTGESDNVFLDIRPGEYFDFRFEIPKDHPAGTFWYHPHKHGSVALQMASGMSGALIVEGGLDGAPELAGVQEKVMVFQQLNLPDDVDTNGVIEITPGSIYKPGNNIFRVTIINGEVTPTLTMRPGEVQRWRLIHAGLEETINLGFDPVKFHEIALDGIATGTMTARSHVELQPGYRADVLVKAPVSPGEYYLTSEVNNVSRAIKGRAVPKIILARIAVQGEPNDMALPEPGSFAKYVPASLPPITDSEIVGPPRELRLRRFGMQSDIECQPFDPGRADHVVELSTVEEWNVSSLFDAHPFHIHVNPFQVLVNDPDTGAENWVWRDTIFVGDGERVRLRTRYEHFDGDTVLHCHNLDHEDRGMMQVVRIRNPKNATMLQTVTRGFMRLPVSVPDWTVTMATGEAVKPDNFLGGKWLLVLHKGFWCIHCSRQINLLAADFAEFKERDVRILAVCPDLISIDMDKEWRERFASGFVLASDKSLTVFRAQQCFDKEALHGIYFIDAEGKIRWQSVADEPFTDIDCLTQVLDSN
ncbi:MAG: multicopper oxidase domain-containing protein [Candidatus Hydrogenedentes bacterium]|nr:multicopper oxidase domain-containing protein [Candidatus Hydrogenedentota bacterium]